MQLPEIHRQQGLESMQPHHISVKTASLVGKPPVRLVAAAVNRTVNSCQGSQFVHHTDETSDTSLWQYTASADSFNMLGDIFHFVSQCARNVDSGSVLQHTSSCVHIPCKEGQGHLKYQFQSSH